MRAAWLPQRSRRELARRELARRELAVAPGWRSRWSLQPAAAVGRPCLRCRVPPTPTATSARRVAATATAPRLSRWHRPTAARPTGSTAPPARRARSTSWCRAPAVIRWARHAPIARFARSRSTPSARAATSRAPRAPTRHSIVSPAAANPSTPLAHRARWARSARTRCRAAKRCRATCPGRWAAPPARSASATPACQR